MSAKPKAARRPGRWITLEDEPGNMRLGDIGFQCVGVKPGGKREHPLSRIFSVREAAEEFVALRAAQNRAEDKPTYETVRLKVVRRLRVKVPA